MGMGEAGSHLNIKMVFPGMGVPISKIKFWWGRSIFVMEISINIDGASGLNPNVHIFVIPFHLSDGKVALFASQMNL